MNAAAFVIAGHRGAMALEPENTMRSFARAVEIGVDEIELDVHLSRDGRLVVMHDETVDRTTNGWGAIADQDWAQLSALDAGQGERIPLLTDVLDTFETMGFQIEVKAPAATRAVLDVLAERAGRAGHIHITSFHVDALGAAVTEGRFWRVGLICGKNDAPKVASARAIGVDQLLLRWDLVDAPGVAEFAAEGGVVSVWPGNHADEVRTAIEGGYAGTTTDDPRVALAVRAELAAAGAR
jgi:glycerophosphoryl diester phosphodiesterase